MDISLKPSAFRSLSKSLHLAIDEYSQDFDLESANSERVVEFIHFYFTHQERLDDDEKRALMAIIIASFDQKLIKGNTVDEITYISTQINTLLQSNLKLFSSLIEYWSTDENEVEPSRIAKFIDLIN